MQKNYLTDYIESKGYTVQECRRPAKKEVPANMRHRYSTCLLYTSPSPRD